ERIGDRERLVADRDRARDRDVLLGVAAREHLLGIEVGLLLAFLPFGFTAPRPSDRLQDEVDGARRVRVVVERALRIRLLARARQYAHFSVVGDVVLGVR